MVKAWSAVEDEFLFSGVRLKAERLFWVILSTHCDLDADMRLCWKRKPPQPKPVFLTWRFSAHKRANLLEFGAGGNTLLTLENRIALISIELLITHQLHVCVCLVFHAVLGARQLEAANFSKNRWIFLCSEFWYRCLRVHAVTKILCFRLSCLLCLSLVCRSFMRIAKVAFIAWHTALSSFVVMCRQRNSSLSFPRRKEKDMNCSLIQDSAVGKMFSPFWNRIDIFSELITNAHAEIRQRNQKWIWTRTPLFPQFAKFLGRARL